MQPRIEIVGNYITYENHLLLYIKHDKLYSRILAQTYLPDL